MFSLTLVFPVVGRDDSQRKHTHLFFMLGPLTQCAVHNPYFHPSVSVSPCLRKMFLSLLFNNIFQKMIWSFLSVCVCVRVSFAGNLHQEHAHTHIYADSNSCCVIVSYVHWWENRDQVVGFSRYDITESDIISTPFLLTHTHSMLFPCILAHRCLV